MTRHKDDDVDFDTIRSDIAQLKDDIQSLAATMLGQGRANARHLRKEVQDRVEQGTGSVEEFVEQRPLTSMLIVFGVGVAAGIIAGRK